MVNEKNIQFIHQCPNTDVIMWNRPKKQRGVRNKEKKKTNMHGRYYVYQRPNIMLLYLMHFFQAVRHVFFHCLCDVNIYFSQID